MFELAHGSTIHETVQFLIIILYKRSGSITAYYYSMKIKTKVLNNYYIPLHGCTKGAARALKRTNVPCDESGPSDHSKEGSGDSASQRSEHWNVEGGAIISTEICIGVATVCKREPPSHRLTAV